MSGQRALIAQRRLKRLRKDLEHQLSLYFGRGAVVESAGAPGTSTVGVAGPPPTAFSSAEPDGPDMQQQYKTLFGLY